MFNYMLDRFNISLIRVKISVSLFINTIHTNVVLNRPFLKYMLVKGKYVCFYVLFLTKYLLVECGSQALNYVQLRFMIPS
jgi:hypothetical protein